MFLTKTLIMAGSDNSFAKFKFIFSDVWPKDKNILYTGQRDTS